jgi:hypothetical protein
MLLDERPLSAPDAPPPAPAVPARRRRVPGWALLTGGSLLLAALSLLLPSAPTYDPWAWIVWGREITQGDLLTTAGPSWKPLPVLLTTPFALAGDAAPDLWLVVARAGFVAAVPLTFELARRLGGGIPGGAAAAAAVALAPWFARNAALGNSEPLLVALVLGAVLRALDGHHRSAFALAVAGGLLRPEMWPFLGLYGAWLMWRRHLSPLVVVGAGAATVALWTLPELWGSGDALRAITRAQEPNPDAATFSENPALTILKNAFGMVPWPVEAGLVAAAALLVARRDRRIAALVLGALGWLAIVAVMTDSGGFSGNTRYLIPPVVLLVVLAGAGAGWAVQHLPARGPAFLAGATLALAVPFGLAHLDALRTGLDTARYQATLTDDLAPLVERAGGPDALLACGTPVTGAFLVPQVAWALGVHTSQVTLDPKPGSVVFRVRTIEGAAPVPSLRALGGPGRTLATAADRWRVVAACGGRG